MTTTIQPLCILITGFGPFPGVPFNVSSLVATRLSHAAKARWPHHRFEARELPTEWVGGPEILHELWDELLPDIAIHFGVSSEAKGLQLETTARNHCRMVPDAAGALPARVERVEGGANEQAASLPLEAIMRRLQALRIPCCMSADAGAYLCNAILYESISRALAARPIALSGFVHLPSALADAESSAAAAASPAPISVDAAVAGGIAILQCALDELAALRGTVSTIDSPRLG